MHGRRPSPGQVTTEGQQTAAASNTHVANFVKASDLNGTGLPFWYTAEARRDP
jgi:hypothetical protein